MLNPVKMYKDRKRKKKWKKFRTKLCNGAIEIMNITNHLAVASAIVAAPAAAVVIRRDGIPVTPGPEPVPDHQD